MKKTIYILSILLLIHALPSCNKWLDVTPKNQLKGEDVFASINGFKQALIGCYISLTNQNLYGKELSMFGLDFATKYYDFESTTEDKNPYYSIYDTNWSGTKAQSIAEYAWKTMYNSIAQINSLLTELETTDLLDENSKALFKAEALGLRAYCHFDLLRLYGPANITASAELLSENAIPYMTGLDKGPNPQKTVNEIYSLLLSDINSAINLFNKHGHNALNENKTEIALKDFFKGETTRFNLWAAIATKARIAMWYGKYDLVIDQLSLLKENIDYGFYNALDNNETKTDISFSAEHIFALNVVNIREISSYDDYFFSLENSEANDLQIFVKEDRLRQIYEKEGDGISDIRYTKWWHYSFDGNLKYALAKYKFDESTISDMLPLIRLPEIYYMLAECMNKATEKSYEKSSIISLLNSVRNARLITENLEIDLDTDQINTEIEKEYFKDLIGEGQLFFYLKRMGYTTNPYAFNAINPTINSYVFPIPIDEAN